MAHDPIVLRTLLTDAAPPDLDLSFRAMFGGIMAYADGKPFASLSDVGLAMKCSGKERDALLAIQGAAPLRYGPDQPPSKSYVLLPDSLLEPETLRSRIVRCAASLPAKRRTQPVSYTHLTLPTILLL